MLGCAVSLCSLVMNRPPLSLSPAKSFLMQRFQGHPTAPLSTDTNMKTNAISSDSSTEPVPNAASQMQNKTTNHTGPSPGPVNTESRHPKVPPSNKSDPNNFKNTTHRNPQSGPAYQTPTKPSQALPSYMTPTKSSSPFYPARDSARPKQIYLIRHGESMGQTARQRKMDRRRDPRLRDCGLTERGIHQATHLGTARPQVDLVVSSPLTRAVHTAMLAFVGLPMVIHYDLAELGSKVPENTPRSLAEVLKDLKRDCSGSVDTITYKPEGWPYINQHESGIHKQQRVLRAMRTLAQRPEQTIAIVCHFHVIRAILQDLTLRPENASPFLCMLHPDGRVELREGSVAEDDSIA
jgi:broad specificity phosphatase PhoE